MLVKYKEIIIVFVLSLFLTSCIKIVDSDEEIIDAKIMAINEIYNLKENLDCDYYSKNELERIEKFAIKSEEEINNCATIKDVNKIKNKWINSIKNVGYNRRELKFELAESYTIGDGTQTNPFVIKTANELLFLSKECCEGSIDEKYFELGNDIDLSNIEWIPIGIDGDNPFKGFFDGKGYEVKNLCISKRYENMYLENIGLFGLNKGEIKNLGIVNASINIQWKACKGKSISCFIGILAGQNMGTIRNCYTIGEIESTFNGLDIFQMPNYFLTGGISGKNYNLIENCYSIVDFYIRAVDGRNCAVCIGGISSSFSKGRIINSLAISSKYIEKVGRLSEDIEFEIIGPNCENCFGDYDCTYMDNPTEEELNSVEFYYDKLKWDIRIWNVTNVNFKNGYYVGNAYPKLYK